MSDSLTSMDGASDPLQLDFDNESDPDETVITIEGKDQSELLQSLTGAFNELNLVVSSASISSDDGKVLDVFRVHQKSDGKKVRASSTCACGRQRPSISSNVLQGRHHGLLRTGQYLHCLFSDMPV